MRRVASTVVAGMLGVVAQTALAAAPSPGTTIVGERDTAVGLYLTPWREEAASDIDRPPRLYEPPMHALEAEAFARDVEVRESIEAYHRTRLLRR